MRTILMCGTINLNRRCNKSFLCSFENKFIPINVFRETWREQNKSILRQKELPMSTTRTPSLLHSVEKRIALFLVSCGERFHIFQKAQKLVKDIKEEVLARNLQKCVLVFIHGKRAKRGIANYLNPNLARSDRSF